MSARLVAYLANRSAMLWGDREADYPEVTIGITSGQGNQGSAATTLNQGQSGTSGQQFSVPRSLRFGQGSQA